MSITPTHLHPLRDYRMPFSGARRASLLGTVTRRQAGVKWSGTGRGRGEGPVQIPLGVDASQWVTGPVDALAWRAWAGSARTTDSARRRDVPVFELTTVT